MASCAPPRAGHRHHARKALNSALSPAVVTPRRPRPPKYGSKVIAALIFCWAVLGMPAGKRLAPCLPELVAVLRLALSRWCAGGDLGGSVG